MISNDTSRISIRTSIKPGDLGAIVEMHGRIYAAEYGFDETFEEYVAGPLSGFIIRNSAGHREGSHGDLEDPSGFCEVHSRYREDHSGYREDSLRARSFGGCQDSLRSRPPYQGAEGDQSGSPKQGDSHDGKLCAPPTAPRERLWIAESQPSPLPRGTTGGATHDRIVGCIAIVAESHIQNVNSPSQAMGHSAQDSGDTTNDVAQLRWFLVDPSVRGKGLGRKLLNEAISFAQSCGYCSIILWTVEGLTAAAKLYTAAGFQLVEQNPVKQWGVEVVEQKYEMCFK